jgi:hypothetical protein
MRGKKGGRLDILAPLPFQSVLSPEQELRLYCKCWRKGSNEVMLGVLRSESALPIVGCCTACTTHDNGRQTQVTQHS